MGKYVAGITEKRLNNRRFRKTEEAILRVFFEEDIYIGIKEMAEKAGVARSTFYHHHKTAKEIVPDYKKYILQKYVKMMNRAMKKNKAEPRVIYGKTMIFMMQNRAIFEMLLKSEGMNVIREMINKMDMSLMKNMRISRGMRKVFGVYASEMVEIIGEWCKNGFSEKEVSKVLENAVYLTNTAKKRLSPIV